MKLNTPLPTTEKRNKRSETIDQCSSLEIVDLIHSEDMLVAPAVGKERKAIAAGIDQIVKSFRSKGRLFYVGAGTSGRLGVLDASECPPTFGVSPLLVQGIIAGGRRALVRAVEGAEDSAQDGRDAMDRKKVRSVDTVVGITACGMARFVGGALARAKELGAATIFISCAAETAGRIPADIVINPIVGPEIITGSTRLKAGTATKLVLNMLTTGAMIRMGKVYGNLMVDLKATNAKLRDRSLRIVMELTELDRSKAEALLAAAHGRVKIAIVMHYRRTDYLEAQKILRRCDESLARAIGKDPVF